MLQKRTGLVPDAYFSASKIAWILDHVKGAREAAEKGELLFGTVDTWLIWNLTKGAVHVTDYTNAARTMLFDIHRCCWEEERRRKKEDSKVRKTKKLLSSYRRIKATLSDGEQFTPEEQAELRWKFIEDLMGNTREIAGKSERTIKDTERKREEDLYCVFRIEKATEMYREECEKSGSEEAKRRYRELSMMYLDEKPYTVQEISEVENKSDKTVYKDIGIACGIVAIYLLGADF